MNKLFLAALLAVSVCSISDVAGASGKSDGSRCHVSKSCSSQICVRLSPFDKFGVCCSPQSCAAVGAQCGPTENGCGIPLDCGSCDVGSTCVDNQCVAGTTTTTTTSTTTTTTTTTSTTSSTTTTTTTTSTTLAPPTTLGPTTSTTLAVCGDGAISGLEECDDLNTSDNDGCDSFCNLEIGWDCPGEPSVCSTICGDNIIAGPEQCDDGNTIDGDGCSDTCQNQCVFDGFACTIGSECCSLSCSTGTCHCFRGDTLVETADGPRPIRDVKVGDRVWSWDERSNTKVLSAVTQTFRNPAANLRRVEVDGESIYTTDAHPYWVTGKGWVVASQLAAGDALRTDDGSRVLVSANDRVSGETFFAGYHGKDARTAGSAAPAFSVQPVSTSLSPNGDSGSVYNLEVDGTHTFFVGEHKVLVHNKA